MQALFAKREALEGRKVVFLCGAAWTGLVRLLRGVRVDVLDGRVAEDHCSRGVVVDCCADALAFCIDCAVFKFPCLVVRVVLEAWVVVAFVEVF